MKQARSILAILLFGCAVMAVVDGVIQPGYVIKSLVKLILFLGLPLWWSRQAGVSLRPLFARPRQGLRMALLLGAGVFAVILGGFFLTRGIFDFSGLTAALTAGTGVRRENFLWVALYISFVNSLLEEFFFRGFGFLLLRRYLPRRQALGLSCLAFALYHVAMTLGWYGLPVQLLTLAGLALGGWIFCRLDEHSGSLWLSWVVHLGANLATNAIGFLLFAA